MQAEHLGLNFSPFGNYFAAAGMVTDTVMHCDNDDEALRITIVVLPLACVNALEIGGVHGLWLFRRGDTDEDDTNDKCFHTFELRFDDDEPLSALLLSSLFALANAHCSKFSSAPQCKCVH